MSKRHISPKTKKKLIIGISAGAFALLLILFLLFINSDKITVGTPTLTIETPQKISNSETGEFTLNVTISSLRSTLRQV